MLGPPPGGRVLVGLAPLPAAALGPPGEAPPLGLGPA